MSIDFSSNLFYGDDDDNKYIKTKIRTFADSITTKSTMPVSINNNARFCFLCIRKLFSPNIFRIM